MWIRHHAWLAPAAILCLLSLFAPQAVAGEEVAQLALADMDGTQHSLDELRGSIAVVNFWATWCVPCREEMPVFVKLQRKFGDEGIRVIGASADEASAHDEIGRFSRKMHLNFPVWVGATVTDMERLGLGSVLPATVIIDRDGIVIERINGVVDEDYLTRRLEWLLSDRVSPTPVPDTHDDDTEADHEGHDHDHHHGEGEEEHQHGGVGMEGASLVPS